MLTLFQYLIPQNLPLTVCVFSASFVVIYLSHQLQLKNHQETGLVFGKYPYNKLIFFAPVYEEVIFRAIILSLLVYTVTPVTAIIISSLCFGLWHIKNITWQSKWETLYQIVYAGLIIGPVLAYVTISTGDIYLAIWLHTINNYLAPLSQNWFKRIRLKTTTF